MRIFVLRQLMATHARKSQIIHAKELKINMNILKLVTGLAVALLAMVAMTSYAFAARGDGNYPTVAKINNDQVIRLHRGTDYDSSAKGKMWYEIGIIKKNKDNNSDIQYGASQIISINGKAIDGAYPNVLSLDNNYVLIQYKAGKRSATNVEQYQVAKFEGGKLHFTQGGTIRTAGSIVKTFYMPNAGMKNNLVFIYKQHVKKERLNKYYAKSASINADGIIMMDEGNEVFIEATNKKIEFANLSSDKYMYSINSQKSDSDPKVNYTVFKLNKDNDQRITGITKLRKNSRINFGDMDPQFWSNYQRLDFEQVVAVGDKVVFLYKGGTSNSISGMYSLTVMTQTCNIDSNNVITCPKENHKRSLNYNELWNPSMAHVMPGIVTISFSGQLQHDDWKSTRRLQTLNWEI